MPMDPHDEPHRARRPSLDDIKARAMQRAHDKVENEEAVARERVQSIDQIRHRALERAHEQVEHGTAHGGGHVRHARQPATPACHTGSGIASGNGKKNRIRIFLNGSISDF